MAAPPSISPSQRPSSRSTSPSPGTTMVGNADPQTPQGQSQKRSLRQRMGTAVRRSSSFLIPSRPTTPAASSSLPNDDPFLVAASTSPTPAPRAGRERGRSSSPAPGGMGTVKRMLGRGPSVDRRGTTSQTGTSESQGDAAKEPSGTPPRTTTKDGSASRPASVRSGTQLGRLYMADTASTAARRASKDDQDKENGKQTTPTRERTSSESAGRRRKISLSSLSLRSVRTKSSGQGQGQAAPPATTTTTATATNTAVPKAQDDASTSSPVETLSTVPENARTAPNDVQVQPVAAAAETTSEQQAQHTDTNEEPEQKMSVPMPIPMSDSPRSLSSAPSHDQNDPQLAHMNGHAEYAPQPRFTDIIVQTPAAVEPLSGAHEHEPAPASTEGDSLTAMSQLQVPAQAQTHPRVLAVRTSLDDLHEAKDLSPILEDARSAEEERAYNQQAFLAVQPAKPSALATVSPVIASEMSEGSDGTTPRPRSFPQEASVVTENAQVPVREQRLEDAEGYFAPVPPMPLALPIPQATAATSERRSLEDPFKDPESAISARYVGFPYAPASASASQPSLDTVPPAPGIVSQPVPETVQSMPVPNTNAPQAPEIMVENDGLGQAQTRNMPVPVVAYAYPLPALNEVTNTKADTRDLRTVPSNYTLAGRSSRAPSAQETDENAPLLPRNRGDEAEIDIFGNRAAPGAARTYGSHRLSPSHSMLNGWVAHSLPDASTYYTNPELRLTTDTDLSDPRVRDALVRYVEETTGGGHEASVPEGWEVWVHDEALVKGRLQAPTHAQAASDRAQQTKKAEGKNKARKAEREGKKDAKGKAPSGGWREIPGGAEAARKEMKMNPVRCWVNHGMRAMGYWPPPAFAMNGSTTSLPIADKTPTANSGGDDALDYAYRYWAFMEAHPAHAPLPKKAYTDALDALTWSYTERLLKTQRRVPPPFSQQEARELLTVLRDTRSDTAQDFSDTEIEAQSHMQAPNAVQTRVVSRILRRVVQWKQHHFRPEKPLPHGSSSHPLPAIYPSKNGQQPAQKASGGGRVQSSFGNTALDVVLAWLCLGIPYLYANRHLASALGHLDEESGAFMRSFGSSSNSGQSPTLTIIGVGVAIVAALILLAALALLALPGLDPSARTAALLAAVGAVASLAASGVAAAAGRRGSVDAQKAVVSALTLGGTTSGEGRFAVSHAYPDYPTSRGGTLVLSLPAVFLAYAALALVAGLVLYVFRGSVLQVPSSGSGSGSGSGGEGNWGRMASYTRWTTVGVLGFCGGVLATSMIVVRR